MKKLSRLALPAIIVAVVSLVTSVPAQAGCGVPYDPATYDSCMAEPGNDGSVGWEVHCWGQAVMVGSHKYLQCISSGGDTVAASPRMVDRPKVRDVHPANFTPVDQAQCTLAATEDPTLTDASL